MDDLLFMGGTKVYLDGIKERFTYNFKMMDLGITHFWLDLEVYKMDIKIFVIYIKYAELIVKAFWDGRLQSNSHTNGGQVKVVEP